MEHWYSFIYLYGIGGVLFCLAITMGLKKKVLKLNRKTDRKVLICLIGAYIIYFAAQGLWNTWALSFK